MSLRTITETDLQGKGNTGQPDVPNLSMADMQHKLDELSLDVIIPIFNLLVGQLEAKEASADLGATVDDDYTFQLSGTSLEEDADTKVQALINTILKECETLDINLYDLAAIFTGISSVASSVSDDPTAIPTSRAIVNYVSMLGGGDMMKSTYDSNDDGVVNDSDKLGGELPTYYQKATDENLDTTDQTTTGAINEVLGAVGDVARDLSDFADTYDESAGGSTIETIGSGAKGSYGIGDLFVADDHFFYKAIAIISPGNTLSIANCTKTNIKAELNTTNTALINKVSKFVGGGYVPVDSIAYDETNKKLGLKVNGADTVIPFSGGENLAKIKVQRAGYNSGHRFYNVTDYDSSENALLSVACGVTGNWQTFYNRPNYCYIQGEIANGYYKVYLYKGATFSGDISGHYNAGTTVSVSVYEGSGFNITFD